jgi:hypothetical protein
VPFVHVSDWVQALPSLHVVPLVTFKNAVVLFVGWHD